MNPPAHPPRRRRPEPPHPTHNTGGVVAHAPDAETPPPATTDPVAEIALDGIIGQIEHWSGAVLERIPCHDKPTSLIAFHEGDLSKFLALCQYKRAHELRRQQDALQAVEREIRADMSKFLDPDTFRAALPDLPVTEVSTISRQEPSPARRAAAAAAAAKMANTKRIKRFQSSRVSQVDIKLLQKLVELLDAPGTPQDIMERAAWTAEAPSLTCVEAMLEYLFRLNVITRNSHGEYFASGDGPSRLGRLLKVVVK